MNRDKKVQEAMDYMATYRGPYKPYVDVLTKEIRRLEFKLKKIEDPNFCGCNSQYVLECTHE